MSGITPKNRMAALCGRLDGGMGLLGPVGERTYRRLESLHNAMVNALPHHGGLNPVTFRLCRWEGKQLRARKKNILDGQLLWQFLSLPYDLQRQLSRSMGTTPEVITDTLLEFDLAAWYFGE